VVVLYPLLPSQGHLKKQFNASYEAKGSVVKGDGYLGNAITHCHDSPPVAEAIYQSALSPLEWGMCGGSSRAVTDLLCIRMGGHMNGGDDSPPRLSRFLSLFLFFFK